MLVEPIIKSLRSELFDKSRLDKLFSPAPSCLNKVFFVTSNSAKFRFLFKSKNVKFTLFVKSILERLLSAKLKKVSAVF